MTSTDSGQSRAAMLMHAARRSHFVARIQKYEAKVRQEQRLRALQREKQKMTLVSLQNQSVNSQDPALLLKGHVTTEQVASSPLKQHETEDMLEHISVKERTSISEEMHATNLESQPSCPKVILRGIEALNVPGLAPMGNIETKLTHPGAYITTTPSAALDVNITAIAAALEVKIKKADMATSMQEHAFQCARECLNTTEKLLCKNTAYTLKKEFDKVYGPAWHCIVGTSFGSYVTHSVGGFVYFTMGKVSVLLFKTTVELVER